MKTFRDLGELDESIKQDILANQGAADRAKMTLATAGLLIALSLDSQHYKTILIHGISLYKAAVICVALAAILTLLSYALVDISLKRTRLMYVGPREKQRGSGARFARITSAIIRAVDFANSLSLLLVVLAFILLIVMVALS